MPFLCYGFLGDDWNSSLMVAMLIPNEANKEVNMAGYWVGRQVNWNSGSWALSRQNILAVSCYQTGEYTYKNYYDQARPQNSRVWYEVMELSIVIV